MPRFIIKFDTNDTDKLLKITKEYFSFEDNNMVDELKLKLNYNYESHDLNEGNYLVVWYFLKL